MSLSREDTEAHGLTRRRLGRLSAAVAALAAIDAVGHVSPADAKKKKKKKCKKGTVKCPTGCADLETSPTNCGACGTLCSPHGDTCGGGACSCGGGALCTGNQTCVGGVCKTISVCDTCEFTTVQAAITASPPGAIITLPEGTLTGKIVIDKPLTLLGTGAGPTVLTRAYGSKEIGPVVEVKKGVVATLENVKITGGKGSTGGGIRNAGILTVTDSEISGNAAGSNHIVARRDDRSADLHLAGSSFRGYGGGIYCDAGSELTLDQVNISTNSSDNGSAIYSLGSIAMNRCTVVDHAISLTTIQISNNRMTAYDSTFGGNLCSLSTISLSYQRTPSDSTTITRCTFSNNSAGSAVLEANGAGKITYLPLNINSCTFENNSAATGMVNSRSPIIVQGTTFSGNSGGAIQVLGGINADSCIFKKNEAETGAGIFVNSSNKAPITLTNCEFTENIASVTGGAIINESSQPLTLTGATITKNQSGSAATLLRAADLRAASGQPQRSPALTSQRATPLAKTVYERNLELASRSDSLRNRHGDRAGDGRLLPSAVAFPAGALIGFAAAAAVAGCVVTSNVGESVFEVPPRYQDDTVTVQDTTIADNSSTQATIKVGCQFDGKNLTITGNTSGDRGGGIHFGAPAGTAHSLKDSTISKNSAHYDGGGIWMDEGNSLTLENCNVDENFADLGACGITAWGDLTVTGGRLKDNGSFLSLGPGGLRSYGRVTATGWTVSGNKSVGTGGMELESLVNDRDNFTPVLLDNCTISGNEAYELFGGIMAAWVALTMQNGTTVTGNKATGVAGLDVAVGTVVMNDTCAISGNIASGTDASQSGAAGVLLFLSDGTEMTLNGNAAVRDNVTGSWGGGIVVQGTSEPDPENHTSHAVLRLNGNSRVSGNRAGVEGGGIYNRGRVVLGTDCRVTGNTAYTSDPGHLPAGGGIFNDPGDSQDFGPGYAVVEGKTADNVAGNSPDQCVNC